MINRAWIGHSDMLIDGQRIGAQFGAVTDILDPSTGSVIGTSPEGGQADVDLAVVSARRSFDSGSWRSRHPSERARILWRAADLIDENAKDLAELEALNAGMLHPLAEAMVAATAERFRYYAGCATRIHGITSEISSAHGNFHAYTLKEPVGVCAFVVPWNFPLILATNKLAPALAVGCSCIVKPSEETPFSTLRLVELLEEAGVPPGVVNVVTGLGHVVGAALASHDGVDKIAFTGSTDVGRRIVQAATGNLKKVSLELGGKSPVVVFDDCDIDQAVAGISAGIFVHSGQVCVAGSRLYVQRRSFDRIVAGVADIAKGMTLGGVFEAGAQIGPIISPKQLNRIDELVASGVVGGAELVSGGGRVDRDGFFFEPTILARPGPSARVSKEEIFGPVLTVEAFDDAEEVAALANDTHYGLASAIWTRDIAKAHLLAKKIQAGTVWLNCAFASDISMPTGGYKQSGWGRELGQDGVAAFLETKSVFAAL